MGRIGVFADPVNMRAEPGTYGHVANLAPAESGYYLHGGCQRLGGIRAILREGIHGTRTRIDDCVRGADLHFG